MIKKEHNLASILEAPIGAIIGFIYQNGSIPGSLRRVKVTDVGSTYIRGEDQNDNNQIKTFSERYVSVCVEVLHWPEKDIVESLFKFNTSGDLIIVNESGDELVIIENSDSSNYPVIVEYPSDNSRTVHVNPEQLLKYMMIHLGVTK